jgi:oligoribonuclease NrnB/cAMP/cGMP phosphodiesterase (DHH superfamily)
MESDKMIKLFTHTDLDGIGCSILGKIYYGTNNINVEYCEYNNINEKVLECDFERYEKIFITDLSVNDEVAEKIDKLNGKFNLIDHHETALWLNKYDWAQVKTKKEDGKKESGTSLLFEFLKFTELSLYNPKTGEFVEDVRRYDTFEYKELNVKEPKMLNDLFHILGTEKFEDKFLDKLGWGKYNFDKDDLLLLDIEREKIERYIEQKNKKLKKIDLFEYTAGVVFAENYISELGNKICGMNKDIDFCIIIINNEVMSFRTIKDINLSKIAKHYGGGGHPKASGSPINSEIAFDFIKRIIYV